MMKIKNGNGVTPQNFNNDLWLSFSQNSVKSAVYNKRDNKILKETE